MLNLQSHENQELLFSVNIYRFIINKLFGFTSTYPICALSKNKKKYTVKNMLFPLQKKKKNSRLRHCLYKLYIHQFVL